MFADVRLMRALKVLGAKLVLMTAFREKLWSFVQRPFFSWFQDQQFLFQAQLARYSSCRVCWHVFDDWPSDVKFMPCSKFPSVLWKFGFFFVAMVVDGFPMIIESFFEWPSCYTSIVLSLHGVRCLWSR